MPEALAPSVPDPAQLLLTAPAVARKKRLRHQQAHSRIARAVHKVKQWSWRFTAALIWIKTIFGITGASRVLARWEAAGIAEVRHGLIHLGSSPPHSRFLPILVKASWLACILSFSGLQFVGFLLFYLPFFPILLILLLIKGSEIEKSMRENHVKRGLGESVRGSYKVKRASLLILLLWLALYANTNSRTALTIGVASAGIFLLLSTVSALSFAVPVEQVRSAFAETVLSQTMKLNQSKPDLSNDNKDFTSLKFQLAMERFGYSLVRRAAWIVRGSKGRNRIGLLVLFQYASKIAALGAATILFWALIIRITAQEQVSLHFALVLSASRVLPGLQNLRDISTPTWVNAGASASAWLLFVVYAGPAASVFPATQQSYLSYISENYIALRSSALNMLRHMRKVEVRIASIQASSSINEVSSQV